MKNLIIIGASGFGRGIYNLALECKGYNNVYQIKGFLDNRPNALDGYDSFPPILDCFENYIVQENDVFVCAFGDVKNKKKCIQIMRKKGGEFISLIHPTAIVNPTAKIGDGCIVLQYASIGAGVVIEDYVLVQISAVVGHDSIIGNHSRLDCNSVCVGGVVLKDEVTIHTSAVISHKVVVGNGAVVGGTSFVIRKVRENTTVFGNPAKRLI